jgi:hypothetical protein
MLAAHVAKGNPLEDFGSQIKDIVQDELPLVPLRAGHGAPYKNIRATPRLRIFQAD